MGLLDKALRGQAQVGGEGNSAHSSHAPASAFPLSVEDIVGLERSIVELPPTPDYLVSVYARLAKELPLKALALLLLRNSKFHPAAAYGFFGRGKKPAIDTKILDPVRGKGGRLSAEALSILSSNLEAPADTTLCAEPVSGPGGEITGLWLYGSSSLGPSSAPVEKTLSELFRSTSKKTGPSNPPAATSIVDLMGLFRVKGGKATALLFELMPLPFQLDIPGIELSAIAEALATTAQHILGASGAVSCPRPDRLLIILFSTMRADPELALFQFRKSLRRALGALAPAAVAAPARALGLSLDSAEVAAKIEGFIGS